MGSTFGVGSGGPSSICAFSLVELRSRHQIKEVLYTQSTKSKCQTMNRA